MFLLKIEPSEITSFFYNIFSISGGGTFPVFLPGGATDILPVFGLPINITHEHCYYSGIKVSSIVIY